MFTAIKIFTSGQRSTERLITVHGLCANITKEEYNTSTSAEVSVFEKLLGNESSYLKSRQEIKFIYSFIFLQ